MNREDFDDYTLNLKRSSSESFSDSDEEACCCCCCCRLKDIHCRSDINRTGAEGISFYYPMLLHYLSQMLAVVLLSQHQVLKSKIFRPHASCGAQCIGHAVSTWSAVCLEAPHSQFGEGARPHLCMDEWNRPTPVRRRLSLTHAAQSKPIPTGLAPVSGTKARNLEAFSQYSVFHLWFVHSEARMPSLARFSKWFPAGTNGRLYFSLIWQLSEEKTIQDMIRVQRSTVSQGECRSHSAKLSWLDSWEYR